MYSAQFLYAYDFEKDGIYYNITSENTVSVTSGNNKYTGVVTIPETVENGNVTYSVTSIGKEAFLECDDLTKVTIGNNVTSIDGGAFYLCRGLTELTIPNSVTSIGHYAFDGCRGLTELIIPNSVTYIGMSAFQYCTNLTKVTFQDGPDKLRLYQEGTVFAPVFANCEALESVYLGRNISGIGFSKNPIFTTLEISNSVTSIGYMAFFSCSGLKDLTIPNSVTSIGESAFQSCSGLTELTIPNSVTSIGERAFYFCDNLTTIVSLIEEPFDIDYSVFSSSYSNATLYVPKYTKSKYTATDSWKNFSKIIEDIEEEKAAAEEAYQEWQKVYGEYVPDYAEDGDVTTLYHQAEAGQEANSSKAQELLSSIEALEKKISESAISEEDKQSYLATLQEMKDKISALEKESSNDNLLSNPAHDEAMKSIENYDAKFADYSKRIDEATTCEELTTLTAEMASDAEAFKTSYENDSKYLEEVIDRLSEILDELKKYENQLKEYDTEIDDILTGIVNSIYGADDEIMVYTLSGMSQKMKKFDLRSLPKGIYIINGRKYVVK